MKQWIIRALSRKPNVSMKIYKSIKESKPYTRDELMGTNMEYSIKAAGGFGKGQRIYSEPFNACIWHLCFNGTPPMPSIQSWINDKEWDSMAQLRAWLAAETSKFLTHGHIIVSFRNGEFFVLTPHEARSNTK